ncbi:hypothetical protein BCV70DRAFT_65152 [Testicularia cyperi]|uniref:Uncharacterized protein n=1 Tax=Testicularia cyperi TaxID=1882483 RepID=A0A317XGK9_9BASI|nr:hypothetical protein BCV70DRAFT_65152 [Testicularia cyperi]
MFILGQSGAVASLRPIAAFARSSHGQVLRCVMNIMYLASRVGCTPPPPVRSCACGPSRCRSSFSLTAPVHTEIERSSHEGNSTLLL